jgi:peptidylprolyl isomerase
MMFLPSFAAPAKSGGQGRLSRRRPWISAFAMFMLFVGLAAGGARADDADPQNLLYMDLAFGRVVIQLRPDLAPSASAQLKKLARSGFYDGVVFHRVIAGFMAQGGDPTGTGTGGSGHTLHAEFTQSEHFVRGTVGMARSSDPNSADSQFFIMFDAAPALDGKYTIVGKVVSGMEFVDKLRKGDQANNGLVSNPDKIVKMQVAADVMSAEDKARKPKPKEAEPEQVVTPHGIVPK